MNRFVITTLAAALFALPSIAGAAVIDQASVALTGEDVTVTLHGTAALQPLRTRVSAGLVRLWFAEMGDSVAIDRRGGDTGVQWLRVRSGANGTGLVQLSFADPRLLDAASIRMEVMGDTVKLRIARSLLPGAPAADDAALPVAGEAEGAPTTLAAVAPTAPEAAVAPTTPEAVVPEAAALVAAAVAAPVDDAAAPVATPATTTPTATAAAAPDARPLKGAAKAPARRRPTRAFSGARSNPVSKAPGMIVLLFLGVLCGGTFIGLKYLAKRRSLKAPVPDVEVLSARRLGPKHQLVMVRAFGRDMLLSVGNGTTQRIASVRSGSALGLSGVGPKGGSGLRHTALEESRAFSRADTGPDFSRSDISRSDISRSDISRTDISGSWAPGKLLNREITDSRDDVPDAATGTFGRELIEAARSIGTWTAKSPLRAPAPRAARTGGGETPANDSISGLLRLRELRAQAAK